MKLVDPLLTFQHRRALRATIALLLGNQVQPVILSRAVAPLPASTLIDAVVPGHCWAARRPDADADALTRAFLLGLPEQVPAQDAVQRWLCGLRFLEQHFNALAAADLLTVLPERWELHWRFWVYFAIADFGPFGVLPPLDDFLAFMRAFEDIAAEREAGDARPAPGEHSEGYLH